MGNSGIRIKIEGFEELLNQIKEADGSIDQAVESAARQSAQIVQSELKAQMAKDNVPSDLINAMPKPYIDKFGNAISVNVGYEKGAYNPDNLSDGYKVVFLNYGTPYRRKHGKIVARGFIQAAKKSATRKVKKAQLEVFNKILGRLKK